MWHGQLVIGPPGAGKTTYCDGMAQMLSALARQFIVVNLDFGADNLPYSCDIDVRDFTTVRTVMETQSLGPNGAVLYCMEELLANLTWLTSQLQQHQDTYVLFDCPGQVELYTHENSMSKMIQKLVKMDFSLTCVHLLDSTLLSDHHKYLSGLLVALSGQLNLELPHVNVMTKIDLLNEISGNLAFRLEYYAEVTNLSHLLTHMESSGNYSSKYLGITRAVCELIEDFNIMAFKPLEISHKDSVLNILKEVDTANGFLMGSIDADIGAMTLPNTIPDTLPDRWGSIQERYVDI